MGHSLDEYEQEVNNAIDHARYFTIAIETPRAFGFILIDRE